MNITLYQIAERNALSKKQRNLIDRRTFDEQILQQRTLIDRKCREWGYSKSRDSKIQHIIFEALSKKIDLNNIFEPLQVLDPDAGVYTTMFRDDSIYSKPLLVKIANPNEAVFPYEGADAIIEGYVGVMLNKLRDKIKNFVFTHAIFHCGIAIQKLNGDYMWCSQRGTQDYVITEFIQEANELKEYVKECDSKTLMIILLQVACALRLAKMELNFSHNDLWSPNVLVQEFERPRSIKLYTPSGIKIIKTQYFANIIDFGFSSVNINKNERVGIFHVPETEHLRDCQITEDFHYLLIDLYIELSDHTKFYENSKDKPDGDFVEIEDLDEIEESMECKKLLEEIFKFYTSEKLSYWNKFTSKVKRYRRLPRVKNEIKVFDEIINGMIDMNIVKMIDG